MPPLAVLLVLGVTVRLTLLITHDKFPPSLWLRDRVFQACRPRAARRLRVDLTDEKTMREWGGVVDGGARADARYVLITCPWCISFWIGLPVAAVGYAQPTAWWFVIPALALTASLAAGLTAGLR